MGKVVDTITGAGAAKDAAKEQARAIRAGAKISADAAAQAQKEIIDRMVPALAEYGNQVQSSQDQLKAGTIAASMLLTDTANRAGEMYSQLGTDVSKLIMGDQANTAGIPYSTFSQQYDQIQQLPPTARFAAMGQMTQAIGQGLSQATGMDPAEATQQVAAIQPGADVTRAVPVEQAQAMTPQQRVEQAAQSVAAGPQTGFSAAQRQLELGRLAAGTQLERGAGTARQDISTGAQTALGQVAAGTEAAMGRYEPYSTAGQAAIQQEAALSGALGPEAQAEAQAAFNESPGQKYLREQQEKALLRSSAAIGGLGGGAVRTALQEQAMNIASTQQQQYLENLRSIAGRGQQVAGAEAGLLQQQGLTGAGITTGASQQLAGIAQQLGLSQAELASMSGQQLSQLAERTGLSLAQLQQAVGQAQIGIQQGLGQQRAGLATGFASDVANMRMQGAGTQLAGQQNLAGNIAGLISGQGTQQAQYAQQAGAASAAGTMAGGQALPSVLSGLGSVAGWALGGPVGGLIGGNVLGGGNTLAGTAGGVQTQPGLMSLLPG